MLRTSRTKFWHVCWKFFCSLSKFFKTESEKKFKIFNNFLKIFVPKCSQKLIIISFDFVEWPTSLSSLTAWFNCFIEASVDSFSFGKNFTTEKFQCFIASETWQAKISRKAIQKTDLGFKTHNFFKSNSLVFRIKGSTLAYNLKKVIQWKNNQICSFCWNPDGENGKKYY